MALGQTGPVGVPITEIAIVNVNVIPMDRERLNAGQTVLIRGDRIVAIGAAGQLAVIGGGSFATLGGQFNDADDVRQPGGSATVNHKRLTASLCGIVTRALRRRAAMR